MEISKAVSMAFDATGGSEVSVSELANHIKTFIADFKDSDPEALKKRVSSYLALNVKKKDSVYAKAVNPKTKKLRKGIYILATRKKTPVILSDRKKASIPAKTNKTKDNVQNVVMPDYNAERSIFEYYKDDKYYKSFFGKAGEYAVVSELLFHGYNASIMSVDIGIDITASKDDKFYFIQVKSTEFSNDSFSVSIKPNRFINNSNSNIYYIIVFRYVYKNVYTNRFIILESKILENHIFSGAVSQKEDGTINIKIKQEEGHIYLYNGSEKAKIDHCLDNFELIK
jgi:uncharacterized protein YifE (UPF0438 family)